jgi:hypothetical protein
MHVRGVLRSAGAALCGTTGPALALMLAAAPPLHAQQTVAVSAEVPVASPTGSGTRNLSFGTVMPLAGAGVTVDVPAAQAPQSASVHSGEFRFDVANTRGVEFTTSLPAQLDAGGGATLAFAANGAGYGGWCAMIGAAACVLTNFNPTAASVRACRQVLGNGNCHPVQVWPASTTLAVYIGGAITVPPGQPAGTYSGTITLTIIQVY